MSVRNTGELAFYVCASMSPSLSFFLSLSFSLSLSLVSPFLSIP